MPDRSNNYNLDQSSNYNRDQDNRDQPTSTEYNSRNQSHEKYQNFGNKIDRTKSIISSTQNTFDGLKRELSDKNRLIEQKNREIVKLRMENDELKSNFEQDDHLAVPQKHRSQVINDLDSIAENLKVELERTKMNLFKDND